MLLKSITRELICLHLGINNCGKMTCHLHCIRSSELCIFSKSSCWMLSWVPDADSVIMSLLALWPCEVRSLWFMSVSKRRWLIRDSRWEAGKPAMAENGTSWTVSRVSSFEVFAEHSSAWFPDKWKDSFKDTLVLEQALQTADCASQSFVSTIAETNWIKPVSYKVWAILFALIFSACKRV